MPSVVALDPPNASKRARVFAILALAPLLLLPSLSDAAPITIPTSLLPGQQYRLAFVTAGTHGALSSNIADYDAFVQAEANTEAALSSISWQVIGSTASVSARDHTGTSPFDYPGVPIFLLNDVKLVDDYADLWDGDIDVTFSTDQHGVGAQFFYVWTGTYPDGTVSMWELGSQVIDPFDLVTTGETTSRILYWISWGARNPYNAAYPPDGAVPDHFFALSQVLTVPVPEPYTVALLTLGFAALLLVRRVRPE